MGPIKYIRKKIVTKRMTAEKPIENPKTYTVTPKHFQVGVSTESKALFNKTPGLMKQILVLAKEIGVITRKGVIKHYSDVNGKFDLELIDKNFIFSIGEKSTFARYRLSLKNKNASKYIVDIGLSTFEYVTKSIKSDVAKKAGFNVIDPIHSIVDKKNNKGIAIYTDFLEKLRSPEQVHMSQKMYDTIKEKLIDVNKKIAETIAEHHNELRVMYDAKMEIKMNNILVDPQTKKIYLAF